MASFLSERTVEYALVPLVKTAVEQRLGAAVPLFYWKSREGNRVSSMVNSGCNFKILAMFARRPKLTSNPLVVEGKINGELLDFARAAKSRGIPTIAGFPAVTSVWQLYKDPLVHWIDLSTFTEDDIMFQANVIPGSQNQPTLTGLPLRTLFTEQIADMIELSRQLYSWNSAMHIFSELRLKSRAGMGFMGLFGGYKPVYFLVPMPAEDSA